MQHGGDLASAHSEQENGFITTLVKCSHIMLTPPCNLDPLKPQFYLEKLGISAEEIRCVFDDI